VRILFLSHRLPYAPNRGDRLRAHALLRALHGWAQVDLVSLAHDADEASHAGELHPLTDSVTVLRTQPVLGAARAAGALLTGTPLTHALLHAPGLTRRLAALVAERRPDLVFAYCSGMAAVAMMPPLAGIPFVLDMVDLDSRKWGALAAASHWPVSWVYGREARLMTRFEQAAAQRARHVLVVNARERDAMLAIEPDARVTVVPNGVALDLFRPAGPPVASRTVVFCGVMNYRPNEDGARWMAREVWPLVRQRCPDARLSLVGMHPTAAVRALASTGQAIEVTGAVPDVLPYLWRSALAVAPLHVARGLQNKVLEALASGLPCVVTPVVAEGLPADALPGCEVGADAAAFAAAIVRGLTRSPDERRAMAARARLDGLRWEQTLAPLRPILDAAAALR